MAHIGTLTAVIGADVGPLQRSLSQSQMLIHRFAQTSARAIFSLQGAFVALAGGAGVGMLPKNFLEVGIAADRMSRGLTAALGSIEAARDAQQFLREESERLGLVFRDQIGAYQSLAAAAKGTALEGNAVREIYLAVAEAGTVMQLSSDQMRGALVALQQMISKGTVQAEELRGQLGERLPGAFQIAAQAMGVTTAELGKMLEQGEVIADEFLPRFAAALRERFAGGAEDAASSAAANLNRLKNTWFDFQATIMESGIIEAFTQTIKAVNEGLKAWLDTNREAIKLKIPEYIDAIRSSFSVLSTAVGQAWDILSAIPLGVIDFFERLQKETSNTTKELEKMADALNEIKPPDKSPWEKFNEFTNRLVQNQVEWYKFLGKSIGEIFGAIAMSAWDAARSIAKAFNEAGQAAWDALTFRFDEAKEHAKGILKELERGFWDWDTNVKTAIDRITQHWKDMEDAMSGRDVAQNTQDMSPAIQAAADSIVADVRRTTAEIEKRTAALKKEKWELHEHTMAMVANMESTREYYELMAQETQFETWLRSAEVIRQNTQALQDFADEFVESVRTIEEGAKEMPDQVAKATEGSIALLGAFRSSFEATFFDLFKDGAQDIGNTWKQVVEGMVQTFQRALWRMLMEWLLFKANLGGTVQGGGFMGLIGSLLNLFKTGGGPPGGGIAGSLMGAQGGGWITEEVWGVGASGRRYKFAEGGRPERVSTMEQTYLQNEWAEPRVVNVYIAANDALSFRQMLQRDPDAIRSVIYSDAQLGHPAWRR